MAEIPLDDDDVESSAMMEAMGFSGFGMQRPAKKRKFNPHADASVSGALPQKPTAASSTGANSAPLGERRLPPPPASLPTRPPATVGGAAGGDADEIDLDGDEDDGDGVTDGAGQDGAGEDEPGPRYIDTSRPSRDYFAEELEDMEIQGKINTIVAGGAPGSSTHAASQVTHQQASGSTQRRQPGRPGKKAAADMAAGAPWWEEYYDAKMNENPWEKLERQRGLEARGTWLSRGGGAGAGQSGAQLLTAVGGAEDAKAVGEEKDVVPAGTSLQTGEAS